MIFYFLKTNSLENIMCLRPVSKFNKVLVTDDEHQEYENENRFIIENDIDFIDLPELIDDPNQTQNLDDNEYIDLPELMFDDSVFNYLVQQFANIDRNRSFNEHT
jgi:hypothetical protein